MTLKWPEINSDKLEKGPRQNGISKLEPSEFQIGDDDETYMIGAEVGYVMGLEKVISECPKGPPVSLSLSGSEVLIPGDKVTWAIWSRVIT